MHQIKDHNDHILRWYLTCCLLLSPWYPTPMPMISHALSKTTKCGLTALDQGGAPCQEPHGIPSLLGAPSNGKVLPATPRAPDSMGLVIPTAAAASRGPAPAVAPLLGAPAASLHTLLWPDDVSGVSPDVTRVTSSASKPQVIGQVSCWPASGPEQEAS